MPLSKQSIENLLDLVEIKIGALQIVDRDDQRVTQGDDLEIHGGREEPLADVHIRGERQVGTVLLDGSHGKDRDGTWYVARTGAHGQDEPLLMFDAKSASRLDGLHVEIPRRVQMHHVDVVTATYTGRQHAACIVIRIACAAQIAHHDHRRLQAIRQIERGGGEVECFGRI